MRATGAPSVEGQDSQVLVFAAGLATIAVGTPAVIWAVAARWALAAVLGFVMIAIAWLVPTTRSARILRYLVAGLGVFALLGAVSALLVNA